jgi:hypothetical protein
MRQNFICIVVGRHIVLEEHIRIVVPPCILIAGFTASRLCGDLLLRRKGGAAMR